MEVIHAWCENCGRVEEYTDRCPRCGKRPGAFVCSECLRPLEPSALCTNPACVALRERIEVTRAFMREVFGEERSKKGVDVVDLLRATVQEVVRLRALVEHPR